MKKQVEEEKQGFEQYLRKIYMGIENEEYSQSLNLLQKLQLELEKQQASLQKTEAFSLKAYIFILLKRYSDALELLELCLQRNKYHLISKKRRALVLQKVPIIQQQLGKPQEALEQFERCLWIQPESKSLKSKIKKLGLNSSKSESVSSEGNLIFQQKFLQKQKQEQKQVIKQQKTKEKVQHNVKFGSFEIIDVGMEDSDQRNALIKQEINKLSEKKPKKSILKQSMSSSAFQPKQKSEESKKEDSLCEVNNQQEKIEQIEGVGPKTKQKGQPKKKAKSVTFKGDTNLSDFN